MLRFVIFFVAVATATAITPRIARGACRGAISRADVVRCAFESSRELRIVENELNVLAGERKSASTLLPANPTISVTAGSRRLLRETSTGERLQATNWYVTLQQELEIAGQRGTRLAVVDSQAEAQRRRIGAASRTIAAEALTLYFDRLAAEAHVALTSELARVADALERTAVARAQEGLVSRVDTDLARAEALRLRALHVDALRRRAEESARLASLLTGEPTNVVEPARQLDNELPPAEALTRTLEERLERGVADREDIAVVRVERDVAAKIVTRIRRSRIPNPTLNLSVQNDGFDELVVLGGLSMPIPLPSPIGQTRAGEIASARASQRRAELEVDALTRTVRLEIVVADAAARSARSALALYTPDLLDQARADLRSLADAASTRQLNIREALLAQRALIELLQSAIAAQHAWAIAWVELERASGSPILAAIGGGR